MTDQDVMQMEIAKLRDEVAELRRRMEPLERKYQTIPNILLLSQNPFLRGMSIIYHALLGGLAIFVIWKAIQFFVG